LLNTRASLLLIGVSLALSCFSATQDNSTHPTRPLPVNVLDRQGSVIRDLRKENFRVLIDGKPVELQDASYEDASRRILILLDISGSMGASEGAKGKWRIACGAIAALLSQIPADSPTALLAFDKRVEHTIDFAQGRPAITSLLDGGTISTPYPGATALFDAILEGLKFLRPSQVGDSIYVISDGDDTASRISSKEAKVAALESGVRLFGLLLTEPTMLDRDQMTVDDFTQLVHETGGSVFSITPKKRDSPSPFNMGQVRTPDDPPGGTSSPGHARKSSVDYDAPTHEQLEMRSKILSSQIRGFYALLFSVPPSRKLRKITLQVVSGRQERKEFQIVHPRAIPPAR
jgi:hypothetical protein